MLCILFLIKLLLKNVLPQTLYMQIYIESFLDSDMNTPIISTESVLKRRNTVEWWYFGPVILAVVMFLLMGTIFERKIEAIYRRILERRQAQHLAQETENQEIPLCGDRTTSLHTVKTPSQRTLGSYRAGSTTTEINPQPIELKPQCIP